MSCMCQEDLHWVYFIATLSSLRICQGIEYLHNSVGFQDNGSQGNPSVCDLKKNCFVCIEPHLRVYSIETSLKIHIPRFVEVQCQLYDTICGVPSDHPTKIQPSLASPESVPSVWSTRLSSSLRARLSVLKNSVTGSVSGSSPAQTRNRRWGAGLIPNWFLTRRSLPGLAANSGRMTAPWLPCSFDPASSRATNNEGQISGKFEATVVTSLPQKVCVFSDVFGPREN